MPAWSQMLAGLPPFYDKNRKDMFTKILGGELKFTDKMSPDARSLIAGLLRRDPEVCAARAR